MQLDQIFDLMRKEGYTHLREVPGRGLCGLQQFVYTWGLCYGLDEHGIAGRYCFDCRFEAVQALFEWDGTGDPPGRWIKHKGSAGEWGNPARPE